MVHRIVPFGCVVDFIFPNKLSFFAVFKFDRTDSSAKDFLVTLADHSFK